MTQPPEWEVVCYGQVLFTDQCEDGIAQSEDAADDGSHGKRHEGVDTRPQEEQPHAPTRNRFRQRHFTLSFEVLELAELPV